MTTDNFKIVLGALTNAQPCELVKMQVMRDHIMRDIFCRKGDISINSDCVDIIDFLTDLKTTILVNDICGVFTDTNDFKCFIGVIQLFLRNKREEYLKYSHAELKEKMHIDGPCGGDLSNDNLMIQQLLDGDLGACLLCDSSDKRRVAYRRLFKYADLNNLNEVKQSWLAKIFFYKNIALKVLGCERAKAHAASDASTAEEIEIIENILYDIDKCAVEDLKGLDTIEDVIDYWPSLLYPNPYIEVLH